MIETIELAAGVTLLAVQTEKFKSGCFSFNLMRPHTRAAAPLDALLPSVLLRGSSRRARPSLPRWWSFSATFCSIPRWKTAC